MKSFRVTGLVGTMVGFGALALAQDYSVLRINEVIADNQTQTPEDVGGANVDMVEIYNSGSEELLLGATNDAQSIVLTDTLEFSQSASPWRFPNGASVGPGAFVVVFCDAESATQGDCELHSTFHIANDGSEPVTLWGPVGIDGKRPAIDQVWLPPLEADVSFGRFPDGAGPAPVPLGETLSTFNFYPRGTSSFGNDCLQLTIRCGPQNTLKKRVCQGMTNASSGGNLDPHVGLETFSANSPAAGQAVQLRVKVDDEKGPTPPNIASVEIVYRVNGGAENTAAMTYDAAAAVQQGAYDCDGAGPGTARCPKHFDLWTNWDGQIPGQAAGATVEFYLRVVDAQGASDTSPDVLCPEGMGPCDRDFGGPGCVHDPESVSCDPPRDALKYLECRKPFRYKVAYAPRPQVASVVINEIVSNQYRKLKDETEPDCDAGDQCPEGEPSCCQFNEDFIELFNSSPANVVDLAGLWLSDGPFNPWVWQFPAGSQILPLEYLIIWLDRDGGQCPDNAEPNKPCFWECPDPTNPAAALHEYHTNFALNADGDQIYLFDNEANGFGVIHSAAFGPLELNHSLALCPDGARGGDFVDTDMPTPRGPNTEVCPGVFFQRGDANSSCAVDLSDAVSTLNALFLGGKAPPCPDAADANDSGKLDLSDAVYTLNRLFLGGPPIPDPGPDTPGIDPTADELGDCELPPC